MPEQDLYKYSVGSARRDRSDVPCIALVQTAWPPRLLVAHQGSPVPHSKHRRQGFGGGESECTSEKKEPRRAPNSYDVVFFRARDGKHLLIVFVPMQ